MRLLVVGGIVARDAAPLEALDFGVDVGQPGGHVLHVVDVTPEQWDRVRAERLALPAGWSLSGLVHYARRDP